MKLRSLFVIAGVSLVLFLVSAYFLLNPKVPVNVTAGSEDFESTSALIEHIKSQHAKDHLKAFTFIQETVRFNQQGSPTDTTIWYEAIRYPKDFRIDFGDPENGNANINRNDSIYVFRGNELVHRGPEIQEFLILEGGLFHYSVEETLERLEKLGVDTDVFSKSNYKNKPIYIIGSTEGKLNKPQIWLDEEKLYVVRRFSKGKQGELYEVNYDEFKNFDGHWIETWIEFRVDGNLIQTERYKDIDVGPSLDDADFNPNLFGKQYWFDTEKS
ncbi:hypothetical protein GTQ34_05055 [Muricauda sp. JGD-17]|uniref:Outer membrane lipoprotein-sorting protein n=1 Tax=Flagellimonas ochracea TaxID=2696472 RepID=A0A964WWY4_9FLAO|nr:hypothetical protein [Allomuricauda ochracea]NAY91282.1 hypothetical protein [Allomuricauda ochracea]